VVGAGAARMTRRAVLAAALLALCGCSDLTLFVANLPERGVPGPALSRAYGAHPRQVLDVYRPSAPAGPPPVVVFFHGGGWDAGSPGQYRFMGAALARLGVIAVVAGYRLYPEVAWPAFVEDAAGSVAWTLAHAAELGGDPRRVFVMGHSAGAYLAVDLALDPRWLAAAGAQAGQLRGAIGLSGPYDFLPLGSDRLRAIFGAAPDLAATQPANFARGDAPPLLLVHGAEDTVVRPRNSTGLAGRVRALGGTAELRIHAGLAHGDTLKAFTAFAGDTAPVRDDVALFLAR